MGHARALVSAGDEKHQLELYQLVVEEHLSVRQLETIIREGIEVQPKASKANKEKTTKTEISASQNRFKMKLSEKISAKVEIKKTTGGSGKLVIKFNTETDLNRIIELLEN